MECAQRHRDLFEMTKAPLAGYRFRRLLVRW
jgi:hypothetical protein